MITELQWQHAAGGSVPTICPINSEKWSATRHGLRRVCRLAAGDALLVLVGRREEEA
jgi:hypothetical protein